MRRRQTVQPHPDLLYIRLLVSLIAGFEPMTEQRRHDALIDARGLLCPLPLVKARQALMVLEPGASVCVLATDPEARGDFERFSEASGHPLLTLEERDDVLVIVIEKAGKA